MLESIILMALICTGNDAATACQAYEITPSITLEQCDNYFTDSGLDEVENLLAYYTPMYRQGEGQMILSCYDQQEGVL